MAQESNSGFSYVFKNGQAYWLTPYERQGRATGDVIAILYDSDNGILLKHGTAEFVRERYEHMRNQYLSSSDPVIQETAKSFVMVEIEITSEKDLEPINQMIAISGSCNRILNRLIRPNA